MKKGYSYNKESVRDLEKMINLVELARFYFPSYQFTTSHNTRCPFHSDTTPSFSIKTEADGWDRWFCFGEHVGGGATQFIKRAENCSTEEAIKTLINKIKSFDSVLDVTNKELNNLVNEVHEREERNKFFEELLSITNNLLLTHESAKLAQDWLIKKGVHDISLASKFPIGFFNYELIKEQFGGAILKKYGVTPFKLKKSEAIIDGMVFFYYSYFSEISRIKIRKIGGNSSEAYFMGPKTGDIGFFGLNLLDPDEVDNVYLVEGEFDLLVFQSKVLHYMFDRAAVLCRSGAPGTSLESFKRLEFLGFKKVVLFPDDDEGGDEYIRKCSTQAKNTNIVLSVTHPKAYSDRSLNLGEDPADLFSKTKNVKELLADLNNETRLIPIYLASKAIKNYKISTKQTQEDLVDLRNLLISEATEHRLCGFELEDYVTEINKMEPAINSIVLKQTIENAEKTHSLFNISGQSFGADNYGYALKLYDEQTEEVKFRQLTNFIIKIERVITFDDEEYKTVEGTILVNGKKRGNFKTEAKNLTSGESIETWIRSKEPLGIICDPKVRPLLSNLIANTQHEVHLVSGVDKIGYLEKNQTYVTPTLIIENGIIRENKDYEFKSGIDIISRSDLYLNEDRDELLESRDLILDHLIETHHHSLTLMYLGHIMSCHITPLLEGNSYPHVIFHKGQYQSGKTTVARCFMNLHYDWPVDFAGPHGGNTKNSIEIMISAVKNAPIFVDDIKQGRFNHKQVMEIIQALYDMQGRARMANTGKNELRKTATMKCFGTIFVGEDVPINEPSTLSRTVIIDPPTNSFNVKEVNIIISNRSRLRAIVPHFIAWCQVKNPLALISLTEVPKIEVRAYYQLQETISGLYYFLKFLVEKFELPQTRMDQLMGEAQIYAKALFTTNVAGAQDEQKERTFIDIVGELLASGVCILTESVSGTQMGFEEDDYVYLFPAIAVNQVQRVSSSQGNYTISTIASELLRNKIIIPTQAGKATHRIIRNNRKISAWKLEKNKLFGKVEENDSS